MKTTTISKLLYITPAEVQDLHLSIYLEWCLRIAKELGYPAQSLMANSAISKWFSSELEQLEYEAYQTLQPRYGQMSEVKARTIYNTIVADIHKIYPKPLFEAATKLTIINEPHDHTRN